MIDLNAFLSGQWIGTNSTEASYWGGGRNVNQIAQFGKGRF